MMQELAAFDKFLFNLLYSLPHIPVLNYIFAFLSGIGTYGAVWFVIMVALVIWEEIKDKRELFTLTISLFLSIIVTDIVVKNIIRRPRPEIAHPIRALFFGHLSSYSFPSGHTTVAFAAAYVLAQKHKKWAKYYYLLASLIAVSRIYLGQHYPFDVVAGIIFGLAIGYISIKITARIFPYRLKSVK